MYDVKTLSYMFFIMLAVEDLFSSDSSYHKFIRERNNAGGSAELKSGALREDVLAKLY